MAKRLNGSIALDYFGYDALIESAARLLTDSGYNIKMYDMRTWEGVREFVASKHLLAVWPQENAAFFYLKGKGDTPISKPELREGWETEKNLRIWGAVVHALPYNFSAPLEDILQGVEESTRAMGLKEGFFRAR